MEKLTVLSDKAQIAKKPSYFNLYLLLLIFFLLGSLIGFFLSQTKSPTSKDTSNNILSAATTPTPTEVVASIPPPSQAIAGKVNLSGNARIIRREQSDWQTLNSTDMVYHDERIIVDQGSLVVEFTQLTKLETGSDIISEFTLTSLLPNSFLIKQTNGEITYEAQRPISVRTSSGGLIKLDSGKLKVIENLEDKSSTITLLFGSASLATINPENITQVYKLEEGKTVTLDSSGLVAIE